jgi:hypothetical protein
MLSLCAMFEDWLIEDGDYPPLEKGQNVNLSFRVFSDNIKVEKNNIYVFDQKKYSKYNFSGKIIYKNLDIIIVDSMYLKFYIENDSKRNNLLNISVGQFIKGSGVLKVDPYAYRMEIYRKDENLPEIFYNLIVEKIFELKIPEKYIKRNGGSESGPSSLPINEYKNINLKEIVKMDSMGEFISYLLNLNEISENIEKTFIV